MTGMHRIDRIKIIKNILYILLIHVKNQPVLNYARKVSYSLINRAYIESGRFLVTPRCGVTSVSCLS